MTPSFISRSHIVLALGCLTLSGCQDPADIDVRVNRIRSPRILLQLCRQGEDPCATERFDVFAGSSPTASAKHVGIYVDDGSQAMRLLFTYEVNLTVGAGSKNLCTAFNADLSQGQVEFAVEFPYAEDGNVMDTCSQDPSCSPASCQ